MTTQVKIILAALGLGTLTTIVSVEQSHNAVVTELQREDHERQVERQRQAQKDQQDDAAAAAWMTMPRSHSK